MTAKPDANRATFLEGQKRLRSVWLAFFLVALGVALIRDSFLFWVVIGFAGLITAGGLAIAFGIVANWIGFGIFDLFDRLIALFRGASRWPDEAPATAKGKSKGRDDWDDFRPI